MHGAWIYYPRVPRLMRDDRRRISSRCVRNRNSSCTTSLDHTRYKTLPARPKTPILAHLAPAGRTLYCFRHQHDKQGEKSHAPTPHHTPTTHLSPNFACNSIARTFNKAQKRCNSNDMNSKFEIPKRELHAKLPCRQGWSRCQAAVLVGGGGAWPRCRRVRRARAGLEIDHSEPQARVWRSRGRPGPTAPGTPAAPPTPPEHRRRNTPPRHSKAARPRRGRAAHPVSEDHRRITTISGLPRPLSWRTFEMPSFEAMSLAVPSIRGSS